MGCAQFSDGPPTFLQAPLLDGLNCGSMNERLATSVEVTASKIFPAGAGWQLASIVADSAGFAPTSLAFFAAVGLGDCTGVFLGHLAYQTLKKSADTEIMGFDAAHPPAMMRNALLNKAWPQDIGARGIAMHARDLYIGAWDYGKRCLLPDMPAVESTAFARPAIPEADKVAVK